MSHLPASCQSLYLHRESPPRQLPRLISVSINPTYLIKPLMVLTGNDISLHSIRVNQRLYICISVLPIFTGGRKENGNGPSLSASKDSIGQSVKISNPFLIRWAAISPNNKLMKITIALSIDSSRLISNPNIVTFDRDFTIYKGVNILSLRNPNLGFLSGPKF